jgi:hypothetical protein
MTEQEWLTGEDVRRMVHFAALEHVFAQRKLRLFCVAACRRLQTITTKQVLQVIQVAERFAEGEASARELQRAYESAYQVASDASRTLGKLQSNPHWAAAYTAEANAAAAAKRTANAVQASAPLLAVGPNAALPGPDPHEQMNFLRGVGSMPNLVDRIAKEREAVPALLRHIFGNLFRPYTVPPSFPAAVISLAQAVYSGADAAFALQDALLETGHLAPAEHFATEPCHPKGCFALDLILGKT